MGVWVVWLIGVVVYFVLFGVCGVVAMVIGPERYAGRVFLTTFFFTGPLGVGIALLMRSIVDNAPQPAPVVEPVRRKVADGRRRFVCPRCGAENDVPNPDASYDCWRCAEHRAVKPKVTASA